MFGYVTIALLHRSGLALLIALSNTSAEGQALGQGDMILGAEGHKGTVIAESGTDAASQITTSLRFEPLTMLTDLFRKDIVFLMRHGPTDWSQTDARGVLPSDCNRQRLMTADGKDAMHQLGMHLAMSRIIPAEIRVSEWCRNAETVTAIMMGINEVNPNFAEAIVTNNDAGLNLLLSLNGAATVAPIEAMIDNWMASGPEGPLMLITHYTNIEELTQFRTYEGEILILDPKLDNRVLGYMRLDSALPDAIHFTPDDEAAARR
jgi:phosphohistidine phosphatase SixA